MSHVVTIQTKVTDAAALSAACRRLGLSPPLEGEARLYASTVRGLLVQLLGWRYPAVFDTAAGSVKYDTFNGRWGAEVQLHKLLQAYAVEKAKLEARRTGHTVSEQTLVDGSIRLTLHAAASVASAAGGGI